MERSDSIGKLSEALAKAQGGFLPVKRSVIVDFTTKGGQRVKYTYAPLVDVLESCRKALSENGLAVMQPAQVAGNMVTVETLLCHTSSEWVKSELVLESTDKTPQAIGSALTYARRYALSALLGIASEEDDDGAAAGKAAPARAHKDDTGAKPPESQPEQGAPSTTCPVHHFPFEHRTGISKSGKNAGKPYDFYACPGKTDSGSYCQEKPSMVTPPAKAEPKPPLVTSASGATLDETLEARRAFREMVLGDPKDRKGNLGLRLEEIWGILGVANMDEWEHIGGTLRGAYDKLKAEMGAWRKAHAGLTAPQGPPVEAAEGGDDEGTIEGGSR